MRRAAMFLVLCSGCGSSAPTSPGQGSSGIECPSAPCATTERCCAAPSAPQVFTCASACVTAADDLACLQPSDCSGAAPTCCVTAVLSGTGLATSSTCHVQSLGTACTATASCPSSVTALCDVTEVGPLCAAAADCAAGQSCCSLTLGGTTFSGCVASELATLGALRCL